MVGIGLLLWLLTIVTAIPVSIISGLAGATLDERVRLAFGIEFEGLFSFVYFLRVLSLAIFAPVVAAIFADRLGPYVVGAKLADPSSPAEARILLAFDTVGLAVGADPIVYILDVPWVNAASLGRRGNRPVFVVTVAAASLNDQDLQVLCATTLAEELLGRRAGRVWLAVRGPTLVQLVLRPFPFWNCLAYFLVPPALVVIGLLLGNGSDVALALFIILPIHLVFAAVGQFWYWVMSTGGRALARTGHQVADVGAIALLRHPEQWRDAVVRLGDHPRMPKRSFGRRDHARALEWILPASPEEARRRYETLLVAVPAAAYSLAGAPFPGWREVEQPPPPSRRGEFDQ